MGSLVRPSSVFQPNFSNNLQKKPVSDLLEQGIVFFNSRRYFDAHEAWEDLWLPSGGPLRLFYQGLVQAAVGMHHLSNGNLNGAKAQLVKSLDKLRQYPEMFCGINNAKLIADLEGALQELTPRSVLISRL
jgi:predicted metal-dependent hydrolase